MDERRIVADLERLTEWGRGADGAMTRLALSAEDAAARGFVRDRMRELGLSVWADEVGNLYGRRRGRGGEREPFVLTGSHLDTVPAGGRYDGPLGVVAPLEVARAWNEAGVETARDVVIVVFVGEEGSRFRRGTLGSAAASGVLSAREVLALDDAQGIAFSRALATYGDDPPCTAPAKLAARGVHAYVELHIEQGGVLEQRGAPVGVVDAVAGLRQFIVKFTGDSNHAGATPMGLRHDALAAAAELMSAAEFGAKAVGGGAVATTGKVELPPDAAFNIIPGECTLGIDVRAPLLATLDELEAQLREVAARAGAQRGVTVSFEQRQRVDPAPMHALVIAALEQAATACGYASWRMPSGAIHDALHMAEAAPAGMLFVPSKGGKSHCKEEETAPADLARGAEVLGRALEALAGE